MVSWIVSYAVLYAKASLYILIIGTRRKSKKKSLFASKRDQKSVNQFIRDRLFSADLEREINMRNTLSNGTHTKHINIYLSKQK
jgi:hypothetical protein